VGGGWWGLGCVLRCMSRSVFVRGLWKSVENYLPRMVPASRMRGRGRSRHHTPPTSLVSHPRPARTQAECPTRLRPRSSARAYGRVYGRAYGCVCVLAPGTPCVPRPPARGPAMAEVHALVPPPGHATVLVSLVSSPHSQFRCRWSLSSATSGLQMNLDLASQALPGIQKAY
jgi:hypothetical protein